MCTWFPCLVPGSTAFGGFCVQNPSLPRVSMRFFESLPLGDTFWPVSNKKPVSAPEVVPMMSKITEDKLTSPNYLDWSKTIRLYLRSICMANHIDEDPPTDDLKKR